MLSALVFKTLAHFQDFSYHNPMTTGNVRIELSLLLVLTD